MSRPINPEQAHITSKIRISMLYGRNCNCVICLHLLSLCLWLTVNLILKYIRILEKRDNDTLVLLRIKLHSSLLEVFPDLLYYDLITRRKKALLIDDIYWISQSIVENKVTSPVKQCLKLCSENSNRGQTDSSRGSVARFCMENCVHDGRYDADMAQCHLCQIWYHHDCAGTCSQDLENVVVWTCQICRRLPLLAKTISGKLEDVSAKLDELILVNKNLHQQNKELTNIVHHQNKT